MCRGSFRPGELVSLSARPWGISQKDGGENCICRKQTRYPVELFQDAMEIFMSDWDTVLFFPLCLLTGWAEDQMMPRRSCGTASLARLTGRTFTTRRWEQDSDATCPLHFRDQSNDVSVVFLDQGYLTYLKTSAWNGDQNRTKVKITSSSSYLNI